MALPEGFVLDQPVQQPQTLPEGFVLDAPVQQQPQLGDIQPQLFGVTPSDVAGAASLAQTIATGVAARPIAGAVGLGEAVTEGAQRGAERVQEVTGQIQTPLSPEGQQVAGKIGEAITSLGDNPAFSGIVEQLKRAQSGFSNVLQQTGAFAADPVSAVVSQVTDQPLTERAQVGEAIGGALGEAIPQTALEVAGFKGLGSVKAATAASKARLPKLPTTKQVRNLITETAPKIEDLKGSARAIYKEIDDLGVKVKQSTTEKLFTRIEEIVRKEGFNAKIHPKVSGVLDELENSKGQILTVSEIDTLRKVARGAARSVEPDEARLGNIMIAKIDDALDNLGPKTLIGGGKPQVGKLYRQARDLWGRARRSELIEESFEKARNQASGFENGLRTQFRSILNNKKKLRGFKPDEIAAMKRVVRGGPAENTAKALGKFGFTEGQASTMLLGGAGVAGGAAVGGPVGAVIVPLIGQTSKNLAQKLTRNNAAFANDLVKAGDNAKQIINSYFRSVPKAERNSRDLTELLLGKKLSELPKKSVGFTPEENKLVSDVVFFNKNLTEQQIKRALGLSAVAAAENNNE